MSIGTRIKELRKKHSLNQTELGKIVGLSHGTLAGIESGNNNATTETIIKLCEYFKVSSDYLLFGIETEQTISESEQEVIEIMRGDMDFSEAVRKAASFKKKAISYLSSYKQASQHAAVN